ncbi:MAG: SusE domain-containing protein [Prevotella sp.]
MKSFSIYTLALMLGAAAVLGACSDDRDLNPVKLHPTTFQLNTPVYAAEAVDMKTSKTINFSWSQPDFGAPVTANYQLQFSPDNKWTVSAAAAALDASGKTVPTYANEGDIKTVCTNSVAAADINKGIMQCKQWTKAQVPAEQKVYVRCQAVFTGDTVYSNIVEMNVVPYYISLRPVEPNYWYITGACIGDGGWHNGVGKSMVPLYPIPGETYDSNGNISYTGWMTADGFKLKHDSVKWNEQIGTSDGKLSFVYNDGGSKNIGVPSPGYYTVTLNTSKPEIKVEAYKPTGTVTQYPSMMITGGIQVAMTPFCTVDATHNHDWVAHITVDDLQEVHFTSGDTSWGSSDFPHGGATIGGKAITVKPGTYFVLFNDLTGQYNFIYQEK